MSSSAAAQSSGKASGGASLAVAAPHPRRTSSELPDLLDAVPGQIGHAILRASDGTILRPPSGSLTERDIGIVYRMIMEVGTLLAGSSSGEGLQRMTVAFRSVSYAVALGGGGNDDCLYIVKKRSSSP